MPSPIQLKIPTFLKWAGGKQQLLPQFTKYFPAEITSYAEPFLGGGSTFFYILKYKSPTRARAYDINPNLINVYSQVKTKVTDLSEQLRNLEQEHNSSTDPKSYYYKQRIAYNSKHKTLEKAALFIYLNKTCFNGLYRVNSLGEFNVPFNGDKKIKLFDSDLTEASNLLNKKNVSVSTKDFRKIKYHQDDVIYFDPPYWSNHKKNGFTNYAVNGFDKASQTTLSNIFKALSKKGRKVILSNSNTNLINILYSENLYIKHKIRARRLINCDGLGRKEINELLITANVNRMQQHL